MASMVAQVGGMLAPVAIILGEIYPALTLIISGSAAFLMSFLAYFLPETRNFNLPDTIEELQQQQCIIADTPSQSRSFRGMAFSDILHIVGGAGAFQLIHVLMLYMSIVMYASHDLIQNFSAATPGHHCRVPWMENASLEAPQDSPFNLSEEDLLRVAIPWEQDSLSRCSRFVRPQWQLLLNDSADVSDQVEIEGCVDGWEFEPSEFPITIINEWNLVCKRHALRQMADFSYLGGLLAGGIVLGGLADKYGRRTMMILSNLLVGVSGICATFAPNISVYTMARFFVGMCSIGAYLNAFTLGLEWLDVTHHVQFSSFSSYTYSFGHFILAGLAYVIRDWHHLQLATTSIHFLFAITAWYGSTPPNYHASITNSTNQQFRRRSFECLRTDGGTTRHHISSPELRSSLHPESARWLLLQGRHEEALKLLKRVARINRKQLTEADLNIQVLKKEMEKEKNIQSDHSSSPLDLLRVKELRKQTFVLSISWFTILFCYYGIALNLEVIKIDIFLLLVIFGVLDLPMLLVSMAMMSYFGRRIVLCGLLLISSCTFFALTLMPADQLVVRAAFAVIGRMVIAAEFNAIMLLTGELYPTVVRQNSLGFMTTIAQIGTLMAPLIILSRDVYVFIPELSFALLSMISGLLALMLPETLNINLPDTMEDLIRQRKRT
uniref:solute carrier family 22 member 6-B-like isoform X1 n=2 Tax=Myxine glutinosa TaxID=7769 RepID=UPI00358E8DA8